MMYEFAFILLNIILNYISIRGIILKIKKAEDV